MPQRAIRSIMPYLALLFSLTLLTAACAPTTQYESAGFLAMSAEWESRLAELESTASNLDSWPTDVEEAEAFISQLGLLIGELSPLAEANYFPRLAELRWSAIAFEALRREPDASGESSTGDTPYSLAIQLRAIAEERPVRLDAVTGEPGLSLVAKLRERANALEDQDIKKRINDARKFLPNPKPDPEGSSTRRDVSDMATGVPENPKPGPEESSTDDAVIYELLDYLSYYEDARPDWAQYISEVREPLEDTIAAREAETLDKPRRGYQAWALTQIWGFEKAFEDAKSDEGLSFFDFIPDNWTWEEEEFVQIRDAMILYLLPINQTLLDLPVVKHYQNVFDIGWQVLNKQNGRTAQTCVAIASAIVPKQTFLNFASYSPQSDGFDESAQWEARGCER